MTNDKVCSASLWCCPPPRSGALNWIIVNQTAPNDLIIARNVQSCLSCWLERFNCDKNVTVTSNFWQGGKKFSISLECPSYASLKRKFTSFGSPHRFWDRKAIGFLLVALIVLIVLELQRNSLLFGCPKYCHRCSRWNRLKKAFSAFSETSLGIRRNDEVVGLASFVVQHALLIKLDSILSSRRHREAWKLNISQHRSWIKL